MSVKYYYVVRGVNCPAPDSSARADFLIEPNTGSSPELEQLQKELSHIAGEAIEVLNGSQAGERLGRMVADNEPWKLFDDSKRLRGGTVSANPPRGCGVLDWWSNAEPEIENQAISDAVISRLRQIVKEQSNKLQTLFPRGGPELQSLPGSGTGILEESRK